MTILFFVVNVKENANFANFSGNNTHLKDRIDHIKEAKTKYNSYKTDEWIKAFFDDESGGYCVYHKKHQFKKSGGGGKAEKEVGKILARLGKQVVFLPEGKEKGPDIYFDNQTWDIKYIDKANQQTIRNDIKDARKADNAIFYFLIESQYDTLVSATKRELGRFEKVDRVLELPDIYYINRNMQLMSLWKKSKEAKK